MTRRGREKVIRTLFILCLAPLALACSSVDGASPNQPAPHPGAAVEKRESVAVEAAPLHPPPDQPMLPETRDPVEARATPDLPIPDMPAGDGAVPTDQPAEARADPDLPVPDMPAGAGAVPTDQPAEARATPDLPPDERPAPIADNEPKAERPNPSPVKSTPELEKYKREIREKFPRVAGIDVETLSARLRDENAPLLLDARERKEFAVSHLRGARRAATVAEALVVLEGVPKDREIVVYCSIGYRSGQLADQLGRAGYSSVQNLEGSIFEWANTGHPVYRGELRVREVHPYDLTWGRMLDRKLWPQGE